MNTKNGIFVTLVWLMSTSLWCAYKKPFESHQLFKLSGEPLSSVIKDLVCHYGPSALEFQDTLGRTLVHLAVASNKPEHLVLFLAHGANPNAINNEHETPLHYAAWRGSAQITDILLRAGADPAIKNDVSTQAPPLHIASGLDTPLHIAVRFHHYETAKRLIAGGAPINAQNNRGKTPLHAAVKNRDVALTQLLINNGADSTIADKKGRTPLFLATHMYKQNPQIIRLLTEHGVPQST